MRNRDYEGLVSTYTRLSVVLRKARVKTSCSAGQSHGRQREPFRQALFEHNAEQEAGSGIHLESRKEGVLTATATTSWPFCSRSFDLGGRGHRDGRLGERQLYSSTQPQAVAAFGQAGSHRRPPRHASPPSSLSRRRQSLAHHGRLNL